MNNKIIAFTIALCVFFPSMAYSQNKMYLKLDGVDGDATDVNHRGWSNILSFENGISNSGAISAGGSGAGKVRFSDMKLTKLVDKISPVMIRRAASGSHFRDVIIEIAGSDSKPIYSIRLSDVFITNIITSAECNPACTATEEVKLSFSKATWEYRDKDGSIIKSGWDVKENRAL
jgi:type VI secretion system secreted protein Hcp